MDGDNISSNMDERAGLPNNSQTKPVRQSIQAKRITRQD